MPTAMTNRQTRWVVVADESRAIVYSQDFRRGPLTEIATLDNETAQKKTAELISDRGGRAFDSVGQGRHTMAHEKTDPKRHAAIAFAKKIAGRITSAMQAGRCEAFVLIAAPRFLGELRAEIKKAGHAEPYATVNKEVVGRDVEFIQSLIAEL